MAANGAIPEGSYYTTRRGHRFHYHEAGERADGKPTVLFLHGSGPGASGYSNFKGNYPAFAAAGHHCLAIDYPGYGYASHPTDIDFTADFYVAEISDLLAGLGIAQVVPVGNSLGGLLATAFTLANPAMVPKLILMAPGGLADGSTYIPYQVGLAAMFQWAVARPTDAASFRRLLGLLLHDQTKLTDEVFDERFPIALAQPSETWTRMRFGHHAERLGEIACPILAFWGAKDKFIPVSHGLVLTERARDARLIVSSRCGHWYQIEERDNFNAECLAFLAGHAG